MIGRITVLIWATVALANPCLAQSKPKEPTPTLDTLAGPSKAIVTKRAKHFYRTPSGFIIDFNNYETWRDVYLRNIAQQSSGTVDSLGQKRVTSVDFVVQKNDDTLAWGLWPTGSYSQTPLGQVFYKGSEQPTLYKTDSAMLRISSAVTSYKVDDTTTVDSRAVWLGYLFEYPTNKKHGKPSWTVEGTSVKGVYLIKVAHMDYRGTTRGTTEFACEIDEQELRRNELKGNAYIFYPSAKVVTTSSKDSSGTSTKRIDLKDWREETIGGETRPIYTLVPAESLRLTPEETAKLSLSGELPIVVWTVKKESSKIPGGLPSFTWNSKTAEIKTKPTLSPSGGK